MLLGTLTHISIFVGLALSQQGESSNDFKGGMSSITQLARRQNNFTWTNTSTLPAEATVEIQFDGLVGSGVINLTSHAGFTVIDLTSTGVSSCSLSSFTANMTSAGIWTTNGYSPTATFTANTTLAPSNSFMMAPTMANLSTATLPANTTLAPSNSFTMAPTMTNLSTVSNRSTSSLLPPQPPTSANISLFTGAGVLSKIPPGDLLTWLVLASLPTAMLLEG